MTEKRSGVLIVLEGGEGSGKTTQLGILKNYLSENNFDHIAIREPGSTKTAERVRAKLLDKTSLLSKEQEVELFNEARLSLYEEIILPALGEGKIVISDRSYISTLAYQSENMDDLEKFYKLCLLAVKGRVADLTMLINPGSAELGLARSVDKNRFEEKGLAYHQKVYNNYYNVLPKFLREKENGLIEIVDGRGSIEEVAELVKNSIRKVLSV